MYICIRGGRNRVTKTSPLPLTSLGWNKVFLPSLIPLQAGLELPKIFVSNSKS